MEYIITKAQIELANRAIEEGKRGIPHSALIELVQEWHEAYAPLMAVDGLQPMEPGAWEAASEGLRQAMIRCFASEQAKIFMAVLGLKPGGVGRIGQARVRVQPTEPNG